MALAVQQPSSAGTNNDVSNTTPKSTASDINKLKQESALTQ